MASPQTPNGRCIPGARYQLCYCASYSSNGSTFLGDSLKLRASGEALSCFGVWVLWSSYLGLKKVELLLGKLKE